MNSRRIGIREVLMKTALGRQTLKALGEPEQNGRTLELVTAPIFSGIVSNIKDCLDETGEEFGRRFQFSGSYANRCAKYGIKDKALAAQFRMHILEGIENPARPDVTPHQISMLADVCGGLCGLSEETNMSLNTIRVWMREGIDGPQSRWPYVFKMAAGWVFVEEVGVMA